MKAAVDRTVNDLETAIETSEDKLNAITRGLLPVADSKVSSAMKKLWAKHKQMMEIQIAQNQIVIAGLASPLSGGKPYPVTDPMRDLMEECVLLGNTITATDAAMTNLGAGGFGSSDMSSGFSGFGSSKDDDADDEDSGGMVWF